MTYLRRRDERILDPGHAGLQGSSGSTWWLSNKGRRRLTKFVNGQIVGEINTVGRAGQQVFSYSGKTVVGPGYPIYDSYILSYGFSPYSVKDNPTLADRYFITATGSETDRPPLYIPEQGAVYFPRNTGNIGRSTAVAYSEVSAQTAHTTQRGIARVGNTIVAMWLNGYNSNPMARSLDIGTTWGSFAGPFAIGSGFNYATGLAATTTNFIIVGTLVAADVQIRTSTDSVTWTARTVPDTGLGGQVGYVVAIGNVAVVAGVYSSTLRLHYSTDGGITWANASAPHDTLGNVSTLFASATHFFVYVSNDTSYYSSNGSTWVAVPAPPTGTIVRLIGTVGVEGWYVNSTGLVYGYTPEVGWSAAKGGSALYSYAGVFE
jgi:hypothetical protein